MGLFKILFVSLQDISQAMCRRNLERREICSRGEKKHELGHCSISNYRGSSEGTHSQNHENRNSIPQRSALGLRKYMKPVVEKRMLCVIVAIL